MLMKLTTGVNFISKVAPVGLCMVVEIEIELKSICYCKSYALACW
jgi:hypothetical protein